MLISAVGTFEEGSLAKELGADRVLMKQKIEDQLDDLYAAIESAKKNGTRLRALKMEIETLSADPQNAPPSAAARLREIVIQPNLHPTILNDAYDALTQLTEHEIRTKLGGEAAKLGAVSMTKVETALKAAFPDLAKFEPDTIKELRTAEYFFQRQGGDAIPKGGDDFSRSIGFSFCFAAENEAKNRLRKKLAKFLSDNANIKLVRSLVDPRTNQLDLFYHQMLLLILQNMKFDFTVDNVRQVFARIMEHESRYKPDGLKALGIMIVCFGREYTTKTLRSPIKVSNPLSLKGFTNDAEVLHFAFLLVQLQHLRNPYIHPEISEMEKISRIREVAFESLRQISRIN